MSRRRRNLAVKKRGFTLLEIMISLAILVMIGSLISIKSMQMIAYHRYQSDMGELTVLVKDLLTLSKVHHTPFAVTFENTKEGLRVSVKTDELLPIKLSRYHRVFKGIDLASLHPHQEKPWNGTLTLLPSGKVLPAPKIYFSNQKLRSKKLLDFSSWPLKPVLVENEE